jgi:hypothetical protein
LIFPNHPELWAPGGILRCTKPTPWDKLWKYPHFLTSVFLIFSNFLQLTPGDGRERKKRGRELQQREKKVGKFLVVEEPEFSEVMLGIRVPEPWSPSQKEKNEEVKY